jgi:hypothetical protein
MSDPARQSFTVTRHAYDPRADYGRRTVHLSLTQVSIERVLDGVKMRIAVPVAAYGGLRIRVQAPRGRSVLTLVHEDPDLNVQLASGDSREIAIAAKAWASVLEKPLAVESGITMKAPKSRDLKRPQPSRRSSFARRRKVGCPVRLSHVFRGESEIIART